MPKVKIVKIHTRSIDVDYDYNSYQKDFNFLGDGLSKWEEVSNEDLNLLKSQAYNLFHTEKYVIIEESTPEVPQIIKSIKDAIEKEKQRRIKYEKDYQKKEKERKAKAEKTKIERAKKLLEKAGVL